MKEYSPRNRQTGSKTYEYGLPAFPVRCQPPLTAQETCSRKCGGETLEPTRPPISFTYSQGEKSNDTPTISPARKSLSSTDPRTIPTVKKRAQQTSYRTNAPAFI